MRKYTKRCLMGVLGLLLFVLLLIPKILAPIIEDRLQVMVAQLDAQSEVPASLVDYQRGWFGATAALQYHGQKLPLQIHHGPILYQQRLAIKLAGINILLPTNGALSQSVRMTLGLRGGMQLHMTQTLRHIDQYEASSAMPMLFNDFHMMVDMPALGTKQHAALFTDMSGYMLLNGFAKDLPSEHTQLDVDQLRFDFRLAPCVATLCGPHDAHDASMDFDLFLHGVHVPIGNATMAQKPMDVAVKNIALEHLHISSIKQWVAVMMQHQSAAVTVPVSSQYASLPFTLLSATLNSETVMKVENVLVTMSDDSLKGRLHGDLSIDLRHLPVNHDWIDVLLLAALTYKFELDGLSVSSAVGDGFDLERLELKGSRSQHQLGVSDATLLIENLKSDQILRLSSLKTDSNWAPEGKEDKLVYHGKLSMRDLCVPVLQVMLAQMMPHEVSEPCITSADMSIHSDGMESPYKGERYKAFRKRIEAIDSAKSATSKTWDHHTLLFDASSSPKFDIDGRADTSVAKLKWNLDYELTPLSQQLASDSDQLQEASDLSWGLAPGGSMKLSWRIGLSDVSDAFQAYLQPYVASGHVQQDGDQYLWQVSLDQKNNQLTIGEHSQALHESQADAVRTAP